MIEGGVVQQDDVDLTFPPECLAEVGECSPFYPDSPRTFVCRFGTWGELL
jgi:hypothetical protein